MIKNGIIWAAGVHNIWVNHKPARVKVTPASIKKDYQILEGNLPIPIGIDHLKDEVLAANPVLSKMNLLNVGEIKKIKLEGDEIHIAEAELTNPLIKQMYNDGELENVSIVSNIKPRPCPTGEVDYIEEYSVINRLDFVGQGGCDTCKVPNPLVLNAKSSMENVGDNMADENKNEEITLETLAEGQKELLEKVNGIETRIKTLEEKEGEKEPEDGEATEGKAEEKTDEAKASDSRIKAVEKQLKAMKAEAKANEAAQLVNGFVEEGKVLAKHVENHVAMAMAAPTQYKASMEEAPVLVNMDRLSKAKAGKSNPGGDDEDTSYDAYLKATGQDKKE
jgi:hypothetical protein